MQEDPAVKLARVPRTPPVSDLVIGGALALWGLIEAILGSGPGTTLTRVIFALVVSLPLIFRRRAPFTVTLVIAAATLAWALAATRPESGTFPFPSLLFTTFSVALYARSSVLAIVGGVLPWATMLVALETSFTDPHGGPGQIAILTLFVGGAWSAGWLVRRRAAQVERAVAHSDEIAREAVVDERARIARELHDVVAHSVSIMAVQAGAAEELIDRDPGAAREHIASVRRTAREAMAEMRRVLSVLRDTDASYAPQPGLARLGDLVEETRETGLDVELTQEGQSRELPGGVDLVAFRVIQEALTNVRKHAPGAKAIVRIDHRAEALAIEVRNESGRSPAANGGIGTGHGVIGMRERVLLFGGDFEAGPVEGGFRVRALIPLDGVRR